MSDASQGLTPAESDRLRKGLLVDHSYELVDGSTRFLTMVKDRMEPSTSRWDGLVDEESRPA